MQLVAHVTGGQVIAGGKREYGRAGSKSRRSGLFDGFRRHEEMTAWMSMAITWTCRPRATSSRRQRERSDRGMRHKTKPIHCVQFPEVAHTPRGGELISNFLFRICEAEPS